MGCGSAKGAAAPAAPAAAKPTGTKLHSHTDDLSWAAADSSRSSPRLPTSDLELVSVTVPLDRTRSFTDGAFRVQVELDGGWRDCPPEEARQIAEAFLRGAATLQMTARGQTYTVDLGSYDGPSQTNDNTGKRRRLRILDGGEDEPPDLARDRSRGDLRSSEEVARQVEYGPQSKRGRASQAPYRVLEENPHAQECFAHFEQNEAKLCGEWAVFYHSYSFAALLYEVHAAVGSVLFRFRSQYATLPRILVHEFKEIPDAPTLAKRFNTEFAKNKRDHHPSFRKVGVSVMCSLASTGPEACTAMVFVAGYSCKDLSFRAVLESLLEKCYVPKGKVKGLADAIIKTSEKHGLDVSQFGGKPCASGKAGHLLQIFVKRHLVDQLVYAAKPYGPVDESRMPISKWMDSDSSFSVGQARIVAHPKYFMQANCVRSFVASADPTFHRSRKAFQESLIKLLSPILGQRSVRESAARGIYGGTLPAWWSSEDQRRHA